ncbi:immunoglobulin mu heavy [Labeo rohita]|nr:immunoglobulin mu heavy [Labeo rohita]
MFPTSLLLLFTAMTCVECNIVLTQRNSIVLQPGNSLTLTYVSGISLTSSPAQIKAPGQSVLMVMKSDSISHLLR